MIELENRALVLAKIQGDCATINGSTVFLLNCVKNDKVWGNKNSFREVPSVILQSTHRKFQARIFLICFGEIGLEEGGQFMPPFMEGATTFC